MLKIKRCLNASALATALCPWALGAAVLGSEPGHAAPDKHATWKAVASEALLARGDANSLATAAALRFAGPLSIRKAGGLAPDSSALELAARASELAPQSAAIGWLRLRLCSDTPTCDIRDVATIMRWVDADNAAAWLPILAAAQRDKDITEIDRVLIDMAQGTRFDLYLNRVAVLMFDALGRVRTPLPHNVMPPDYPVSEWSRLAMVKEIAGSEVIPPFTALMEACRESAAAPERREACLKLSKIMQRGDAIASQLVGFAMERRLLSPDSKEFRTITERRHLLEWRMAAAAEFDTPLLPWMKNARARARVAQMRSLPREEDVCMAILREHKMATEPEDHR